MYNYKFYAKALKDYKDAVIWYEERSENAAENFIAAVENKIETICLHPYRYRNMYHNFHETSLQDFPFMIVYLINRKSEIVIISSLYHHKRNPKKKYKK